MTYRRVFICIFREGSTNTETGKKELPMKCKENQCSGSFYQVPKNNRFLECFVLNEDMICHEQTDNGWIRTYEKKDKVN